LNIPSQRLANHQIGSGAFKGPAEVVRWLGAVQAESYDDGLWAIGLRIPNSTEAGIEQAIADRTIIRTWPMRGTIHFVPAEDARWMLEFLTPRVLHKYVRYYREFGLTDEIFEHCRRLITRSLQGNQQLIRKELFQILENDGIRTEGQRGYHILNHLAQKAIVCFGPRRGKQPTIVLFDEWVPGSRKLEGHDALAELTRRYFQSHGPASEYDFAWWAGLKMSEARLGIEMAKPQVESEVIEGKLYWSFRSLGTPDNPPQVAALLPMLDEFTVAYKDRSALLDQNCAQQIQASTYGLLGRIIVLGGQVVGTWNRDQKKNKVLIETSLCISLPESQKNLIAAAALRYGRFVGLPVELLNHASAETPDRELRKMRTMR
jgi:hypothetical protein